MGRSSWRAPCSGTLDLLERRSWHHSHRIPRRAERRDENLVAISWDEFFKKFDEQQLALTYQETTAEGKKSNFNKLISRDTAEERDEAGRKSAHSTSSHSASHHTKAAGGGKK